jgi:transposase
MYSITGRPSIPPEQLIRALLLQILFTIRSDRQLMERLDYDLMFRGFVGLGMDDKVWHPTVFTKNRDRVMDGNVDELFFEAIKKQAYAKKLMSRDHFSVDAQCRWHAAD